MLRMTPLASAIVALLLGIEAYAAEETFDTHFMIGGMKDQQVANIRLDDNQPGNDSNLLIVFYVQIMPDDFVMQLHRF